MTRAMTVMVMAGAVAAGAGLGVQLGKAVIGEINPIYFSDPPSARFFADLTPHSYSVAGSDQPIDFWANDLDAFGPQGCFDCAGNLVDPIYAGAAPAGSDATPPAVAASPAIGPPAIAASAPGPAADIVRYASFPVSQEEVPGPDRAGPDHAGAASPPTDQADPMGM